MPLLREVHIKALLIHKNHYVAYYLQEKSEISGECRALSGKENGGLTQLKSANRSSPSRTLAAAKAEETKATMGDNDTESIS